MTYSDLFDNPSQETLFTVRYASPIDGEVIEYYDTVGEAAEEAQSMDEVYGWEVEEMISPDGISFKYSGGEFIKMGVAYDDFSDYIDDMGKELWEDMDEEEEDILNNLF
jgi:hypothetical protein